MGAVLGRIVNDYEGLMEVCRQRAAELEISRLGIDELSGLPTGFAGKILDIGKPKDWDRKRLAP